jgi:hypothetical protein
MLVRVSSDLSLYFISPRIDFCSLRRFTNCRIVRIVPLTLGWDQLGDATHNLKTDVAQLVQLSY